MTGSAVALAAPAGPRRWPVAKRVLEPVIVLPLLVVLAPLLALIALAVKLDSRGPVLFRQRRHGLGGRPFVVLKFRTMVADASPHLHQEYVARLMSEEAEGEARPLKKLTDDPRVTRVGSLLRRTSLDELPQLVNVVLGQMSLVGPRPAMTYELEHYDPAHFARFAVRPGLTGLWQVSGRNRLGMAEMLDLDARYARESGPLLDLRIVASTPRALLDASAA